MPPPLRRPRRTRLSTHSHSCSVQLPYARVNQYLHSLIPSTGRLWNSLPDILLILIPILSNSLTQELTSIFNLSFLPLVDSLTLYLNLYFLLSTTYLLSKNGYLDTSRDDFWTLNLTVSLYRNRHKVLLFFY